MERAQVRLEVGVEPFTARNAHIVGEIQVVHKVHQ